MDCYRPASLHVRICFVYMYMCTHCLPEPIIFTQKLLLLRPAYGSAWTPPGPCGFWPSNPAGAFPRPSLGLLVKQADHSVE